jgi:glycosyltransferase involved in cell wall biosynthesis
MKIMRKLEQCHGDKSFKERIRVAAVVFNQGSTDVRVVKEAESLAAVGYNVRIFGLGQNGKNGRTDGGVPVTVLPRVTMPFQRIVILMCTAALALWLLAVINGFLVSAISTAFLAAMVALLLLTPGVKLKRSLPFAGVAIFGTILVAIQLPFFSGARDIFRDLLAQIPRGLIWGGDAILLLIVIFMLRSLFYIVFLYRPEEVAGLETPTWRSQWGRKLQTDLFVAAVEEFNPDIVHCHDLSTVSIGRKLKRRLGAKFIYDSHELWLEQQLLPPMRRTLDAKLELRTMREVDRLITVNDSIAKELQSRYAPTPTPVIIRNATKPLSEPVAYDGRLHRRAKLTLDRRILLFQGGMAEGRGLEALVEAAADLPPDWSVVFMGWGKLEEQLRELAVKTLEGANQPTDRICFLPPVSQRYLPEWTAGASIGIIPYENVSLNNWFCSPNKLWEYPIADVPILASPFPEMSKIVNDYGIGWLLDDPLASHAIAERVWALTPEKLQAARANCRTFIAADNWMVYENRLLELYKNLLPASPSTANNDRAVHVELQAAIS